MTLRKLADRLAACEMVDVTPDFVELGGSDPVAFILSANLARRHMTKGQRAMAGVMAVFNTGIDTARVVGTSPEYVSRARQVFNADPDQLGGVPRSSAWLLGADYSTCPPRWCCVAVFVWRSEKEPEQNS